MLRLMLNAHPSLAVPFESGFIPHFYYHQSDYGDLSQASNAAHMLDDIAEHPLVKKGQLIRDKKAVLSFPTGSYADLVAAIFSANIADSGKPRWGDKTPSYVTQIDVLWRLFPGCRIVHLVRDGRDVAVSLRQIDWGRKNIPLIAQDWRWKVMLGRKMGNMLGDNYLEVRYEDLVVEPEKCLTAICCFLGEEFDSRMLDYHSNAQQEMPAESMRYHTTSVSKPNLDKLFAWKRELSIADRVIFEDIAGKTLDLFGYELERRPSTPMSKLKRVYYCLAKHR